MRQAAGALLLLSSSLTLPRAASADPLGVTVLEPTAGIVESDFTTSLVATISDPTVQTAVVTVNGAEYEVPVEGGRVEQNVVVVPGNNRVGVLARRGTETARDSVTFFQAGAAADLMVVLTWQSRGEIVDLWVREPSGETCKWDHRTTDRGALLDFSASAIGFGSQAYVGRQVVAGRYRIKVHYWGAFDDDDARGRWTYDELVDRLDQLDAPPARGRPSQPTTRGRERTPPIPRDPAARAAERRRVEAALDAWAEPGAPQTPLQAEAILFPGTRAERRWRFDLVVQRTGQLVGLGEVEITDDMIRAARAEVGR